MYIAVAEKNAWCTRVCPKGETKLTCLGEAGGMHHLVGVVSP